MCAAAAAQGQYDFPDPYWTEISDSAKDLVRRLLTVDPAHRFTAAQVLSHPWITGGASSKPLPSGHATRLMMLQARRRLRKGVQMIIAINKFGSTVEMLQREAQREAAAEEQARQAKLAQQHKDAAKDLNTAAAHSNAQANHV